MKALISLFIIHIYFSTAYAQSLVSPGVYKWGTLPVKAEAERETRPIMEGSSPHFAYLEIHAITQAKGAEPGPDHANDSIEALIIIKEGVAKITIEGKATVLGPEGVALLLPKQRHTIENIGDGPLSYYMMRYRSRLPVDQDRGMTAGGSLMLNADSLVFKPGKRGGGRPYFDRPTAMCENFEMHVTRLDQKGSSHQPHTHIDTEIILIISGETEMTIGGKDYFGKAGDLYFINSQLLHGIRNVTDNPCMYFAFKWR